MQYYTVILIIMSLMLGASAFAEKLKIPSPIFLIVVGMVLGFIPATPTKATDNQWLFLFSDTFRTNYI